MRNFEHEVFENMVRIAVDKPVDSVAGAALNLIVNLILQTTPTRAAAGVIIDRLHDNAKMMLDVHYDKTTGKRRLFGYTNVIQVPFHQEESTIFHGKT